MAPPTGKVTRTQARTPVDEGEKDMHDAQVEFEFLFKFCKQLGRRLVNTPPFVLDSLLLARSRALAPCNSSDVHPWPSKLVFTAHAPDVSWSLPWPHRTCPFCACGDPATDEQLSNPAHLLSHLRIFHPQFRYEYTLNRTTGEATISLRISPSSSADKEGYRNEEMVRGQTAVAGAELQWWSPAWVKKMLGGREKGRGSGTFEGVKIHHGRDPFRLWLPDQRVRQPAVDVMMVGADPPRQPSRQSTTPGGGKSGKVAEKKKKKRSSDGKYVRSTDGNVASAPNDRSDHNVRSANDNSAPNGRRGGEPIMGIPGRLPPPSTAGNNVGRNGINGRNARPSVGDAGNHVVDGARTGPSPHGMADSAGGGNGGRGRIGGRNGGRSNGNGVGNGARPNDSGAANGARNANGTGGRSNANGAANGSHPTASAGRQSRAKPAPAVDSKRTGKKRAGRSSKSPTAGASSKAKPPKRSRTTPAPRENPLVLVPDPDFPIIDGRLQVPVWYVEGKLYHSVTNTPLDVAAFNAGYDSDGAADGDVQWRLKFKQDLLHEFVDMMAVEKVFMNMWNQFALQEFKIVSDRRAFKSLMEFLRVFGGEIKRMQLEVVFVRHVTTMSMCGLLDVDGADKIWKTLRERSVGTGVMEKFEWASRCLIEEGMGKRSYVVAEWGVKDEVEMGDDGELTGALQELAGMAAGEDHFNSLEVLKTLQLNPDGADLPKFETPEDVAGYLPVGLNGVGPSNRPVASGGAGPSNRPRPRNAERTGWEKAADANGTHPMQTMPPARIGASHAGRSPRDYASADRPAVRQRPAGGPRNLNAGPYAPNYHQPGNQALEAAVASMQRRDGRPRINPNGARGFESAPAGIPRRAAVQAEANRSASRQRRRARTDSSTEGAGRLVANYRQTGNRALADAVKGMRRREGGAGSNSGGGLGARDVDESRVGVDARAAGRQRRAGGRHNSAGSAPIYGLASTHAVAGRSARSSGGPRNNNTGPSVPNSRLPGVHAGADTVEGLQGSVAGPNSSLGGPTAHDYDAARMGASLRAAGGQRRAADDSNGGSVARNYHGAALQGVDYQVVANPMAGIPRRGTTQLGGRQRHTAGAGMPSTMLTEMDVDSPGARKSAEQHMVNGIQTSGGERADASGAARAPPVRSGSSPGRSRTHRALSPEADSNAMVDGASRGSSSTPPVATPSPPPGADGASRRPAGRENGGFNGEATGASASPPRAGSASRRPDGCSNAASHLSGPGGSPSEEPVPIGESPSASEADMVVEPSPALPAARRENIASPDYKIFLDRPRPPAPPDVDPLPENPEVIDLVSD